MKSRCPVCHASALACNPSNKRLDQNQLVWATCHSSAPRTQVRALLRPIVAQYTANALDVALILVGSVPKTWLCLADFYNVAMLASQSPLQRASFSRHWTLSTLTPRIQRSTSFRDATALTCPPSTRRSSQTPGANQLPYSSARSIKVPLLTTRANLRESTSSIAHPKCNLLKTAS